MKEVSLPFNRHSVALPTAPKSLGCLGKMVALLISAATGDG